MRSSADPAVCNDRLALAVSLAFAPIALLVDGTGVALRAGGARALLLPFPPKWASLALGALPVEAGFGMDLKQISYFMWVYEERSFSKAAAKANVVQSALSMQIRRIEDEFGVQLFTRLARGVEPTAAGRKFYERCVPIARNFALARDELAEASDLANISGEIRVGLPGSFNRGVLQNVLLPFMSRYPDVNLAISEAYTGTLIDWVREGSVDFALGVRPSEEGGLIQKLIYRDRVVLMSGAPLNGVTFQQPCDLFKIGGLKLILPAQNQSFGSLVKGYIDKGQIRVAKLIEINGTVGAFELARHSDWGVLTPFTALCRETQRSDLYIYPISNPEIPFDLYLVYDKRRPLNLAARQFVSAIQAELRVVDQIWQNLIDLHHLKA
jgi:LysR family nitrogen assimilation transcriptional regulator